MRRERRLFPIDAVDRFIDRQHADNRNHVKSLAAVIAELLEVPVSRLRCGRLTLNEADRLACVLGLHLNLVNGWTAVMADLDDATAIIADRNWILPAPAK